ncbi:MAG: histidine kinase [Ilumatobacter sp.]|uniref:sensor histidine kinase n=1 Tax=Ilumatobacter sp. TaxID=1967498 RepID=UPI00329A2ADC
MTVSVPRDETSASMSTVMALAAVGAALVAIFGEAGSFSTVTVGFALVSLLPWAVEAGGVRLPMWLLALLTLGPAAVIVLADRNPGGMFLALIAVVSIVHRAGPALMAAALGVSAALIVGLAILKDTAHETGMVYFLGGIGVAWLAGMMLRRQATLMEELRAAHERQARHAAAGERTRIAREVHDVVAHSLTITMLHVAGARRAMTTDPDGAAAALQRAETVGRESLESIRQAVGLLRADTTTGDGPESGVSGQEASDRDESNIAMAPMPGLSDIPALVEQYREAGLSMTADLRLDGIDTDPATGLAAFRVVQEALSNVLQYAPDARVDLDVRSESDGSVLRITAENPTDGPTTRSGESAGGVAGTSTGVADPRGEARSGLGLLGMSERVRATGGTVEAGATSARTWRVDAALPVRPSSVRASPGRPSPAQPSPARPFTVDA